MEVIEEILLHCCLLLKSSLFGYTPEISLITHSRLETFRKMMQRGLAWKGILRVQGALWCRVPELQTRKDETNPNEVKSRSKPQVSEGV